MERVDPFEQLVQACRDALVFIVDRGERAETEAARRADERRRVEDALAALTAEPKLMKTASKRRWTWTQKQRDAASARMKVLHA